MSNDADIEKAYALIIGISEYKDPGIRRLNYTHADAEGIFKLLTDPKKLGLSKDRIKILLDGDATLFNIKDAISNWLYKNADKDSVVFIFFAGHGGIEKDRRGIEKDKLAKYLLPFDSVVDNLFASAISNRDFNDLLRTIRSKKLVIFMDSCYSGGVSERGARDVKIMDDPYQKLADGEGRFVIAASQPDQLSYENSEIEHGVFTDNLLKALSGAADWDNDGYVKVLDAWKYLQETVPRDAMKLAGEIQEPILHGDITKDFIISIDREHFERIEKERVHKEKLGILQNFYDDEKLSGKQYDYLRGILKIDPGELNDKNKKIVKRINDLLSGNISIPTFLEELEGFEPELFGISEKKRQEQEWLRRQKEKEDRIQREKEREKTLKEEEERKAREKQLEKERRDIELKEKADKEAKLKAQEMVNRLEQERLHRQKEEEGPSYNKLLVVASVLGILFLGYWMIAPGSNDSSKTPDTTPSTLAAVAATASPAPMITSTTDRKTITNSIGMEFVLIPAGEFDMGSPSSDTYSYDYERPVHHVEIASAFYMGKYEVTQKQWRDIMGTNPSYFRGDELPVENVSWDDVKEFIGKLNKKEGTNKYCLPSEAEWEYAARAGTTTRYSFGDDESKPGEYAWFNDNSGSKTHEVGLKSPNLWGLYDIYGNVWEWMQDEWHYDYNGAPTDGSSWEGGDGSLRVYRGAAWDYYAEDCRSASRLNTDPDYRNPDLGFRLLRIL